MYSKVEGGFKANELIYFMSVDWAIKTDSIAILNEVFYIFT